MADDLKPAINLGEDITKELSAEEFQRQLYTWFEDRGLLSELRAHLRTQMISVLKDSDIGRTVTNQIKPTISPKLQAVNLLVAEFLLHQEHHYSLCVFSTEVPLINVFPDFSNCIIKNTSDGQSVPHKWRFNQKDVRDILETFGIPRDSIECSDISAMYYNSSDESLLTCIVRFLHFMNSSSRTCINFETEKNKTDTWGMAHISELLSRANINQRYALQIEDHIKNVLQHEKNQMEQTKNEEFTKYKLHLEEETNIKIETYKTRLIEIERLFEIERKKLEDELQRTKSSLKNCAETLHTRYEKIEDKDRMLKHRQKDLEKKEEELEKIRIVLENDMHKVNCEKYHIIKLKEEIEKEQEQKEKNREKDKDYFQQLEKDRHEFKNEINETFGVINENLMKTNKDVINRSQQTSENSDAESALMKQLVRHLQNENTALRNQNRDQQTRVQQLAQNANILIRELTNSEARNVGTFSANFRNFSQTSPLIVPSMPALGNHGTNTNGLTMSAGSGEELNLRPPVPPRYYRHTVLPREMRRRLLNRRHSNTSSSDEPSPTEEILRQARERLRALEQESEEIDRNFRDYDQRRMRDISSVTRDHQPVLERLNNNIQDNFNAGLSHLDANISRILANQAPQTNIGTFRMVQNDCPSTSTAVAFNINDITNFPFNLSSNLDSTTNKVVKTREQNKLFFQSKAADQQFQDKNKEDIYLDMMRLLSPANTNKASEYLENIPEKNILLPNENKENRTSTGQSANSSGYLQDLLPGTSGLSFSSLDVSSEEHQSLRKPKD